MCRAGLSRVASCQTTPGTRFSSSTRGKDGNGIAFWRVFIRDTNRSETEARVQLSVPGVVPGAIERGIGQYVAERFQQRATAPPSRVVRPSCSPEAA